MKKYSPIIVLSAALVIIVSGVFAVYQNRNKSITPPSKQAVNPVTLTHSSSSVPSYSASPSSTTPAADNLRTLQEDWQTYRDEKYKFEISYPKKQWLLSSSMLDAQALPYSPVKKPVAILYSQRVIPTQALVPVSEQPISIVIYNKPSTTLTEWLSKGYGTDLSKVARGGVDTARAKVFASEPGVLTYNESRNNGMIIYEVGWMPANFYELIYATFFIKENLPYVYEVSIYLPYYGGYKAVPSDTEYIETYKRIVSTFQFTN
jgi:hypothetical protein